MAFPFLKVIRWLRVLADLLPFPAWMDADSTRVWIIKCLGIADDLADETATEVDDKIVAAMRKIVADTDIWNSFHILIIYLFLKKQSGIEIEENAKYITSVAEKAGVDLSIFKLLIDYIFELYEKFRTLFA